MMPGSLANQAPTPGTPAETQRALRALQQQINGLVTAADLRRYENAAVQAQSGFTAHSAFNIGTGFASAAKKTISTPAGYTRAQVLAQGWVAAAAANNPQVLSARLYVNGQTSGLTHSQYTATVGAAISVFGAYAVVLTGLSAGDDVTADLQAAVTYVRNSGDDEAEVVMSVTFLR